MFKIKDVKKKGMNILKNNLWTLILASIIVTFVVGKTSTNENSYQNIKLFFDFAHTISEEKEKLPNEHSEIDEKRYKEIVSKYNNQAVEQFLYGNLGNRLQDYAKSNNIKKGIFYSLIKIITQSGEEIKKAVSSETYSLPQLLANFCSVLLTIVLIRILFVNALKIGNSRIYLESINYPKTRLRVLAYAFREHNYNSSVSTMLLKDIYRFLWSLTIVGGIIKSYSYMMVEYINAENPRISPKDCIKVSREMMNGYKWKAFLLDVSFTLWNLLAILTLGIAGIFVTPYYESCKAQLYKLLREDYIKNKKYKYEELNDILLFEKNNYATYENAKNGENTKSKFIDIEELNVKYDWMDYVLFFFIFAFAGWIWEVGYFAIHFGALVNRGAIYGPWLPIYGFGCTFAILMFSRFKVLKKIQTNPLKTFLCVMVVCTILEYLTSIYLELTTGERYWNYTGIFMNINGRVCLENSMFFGAGGCLCIYFVGPWLQKRTSKLSKKAKSVICIILIALFMTDLTMTQIHPHYGDYISNDPSIEELNTENAIDISIGLTEQKK